MASYTHVPLQDPSSQLRLLQLHPGESTSPISCALITYDMETCPLYHAVSYCWGSPANPLVVYIDGKEMKVTRNCWFALWQIRRVDDAAGLWIDSICINQAEPVEKAAQVQKLADIFQNAEHVLACLGPNADDSQFLVQTLQQTPRWTFPIPPGSMAAVSEPVEDEKIYRIVKWLVSLGEHFGRFVAALRAFSRRPFFTRMWIYQEMFLASTVSLICGTDKGDMHTLTDIVDVLESLVMRFRPSEEASIREAKYKLLTMMNEQSLDFFKRSDTLGTLPRMVTQLHREGRKSEMRNYCEGPRSMEDVLLSVKLLQCQDPRDKVFGVISVFGSTCRIVPDYTLSPFQLALHVLQDYTGQWHGGWGDYVKLADLLCDNLRLRAEMPEVSDALANHETRITAKLCSALPAGTRSQNTLLRRTVFACCISLTESDQLTAPFILHSSNDPDTNKSEQTWSSLHQPIYAHQQMVAIVSKEASFGDWIVPLQHYVSDYYHRYCLGLLLRKQPKDTIYTIIGEVAFTPKSRPCTSFESCDCQFGPDAHSDYHTFFDIYFDCEELLLSMLRLRDTFDRLRNDAPGDIIQPPSLPKGRNLLTGTTYAIRHDSAEQGGDDPTVIERRRARGFVAVEDLRLRKKEHGCRIEVEQYTG